MMTCAQIVMYIDQVVLPEMTQVDTEIRRANEPKFHGELARLKIILGDYRWV